ncbi:MAG TPA: flagellar biosynthetic protein FliO [Phycisphaerae bacterium]|nr:flagellar biosynthetic protein FliO [Phycisphaerae bacterium]
MKRRTAGTSPASFSDMFWPLCAVLLVVGGLTYAAKRWMPRTLRSSGGDALKVVARQSISTKQSVCLVRVGRRLVLIGVTPERITSLSEICDAQEASSLLAQLESGRSGSFSTLFNNMAQTSATEADSLEDEGNGAAANDSVIGARALSTTQTEVRGLLDRVRKMSKSVGGPAEPVSRAIGSR